MTSIEPKCASVQGGTDLLLYINIDDLTASYLKHLTVGFQLRSKKDTRNRLGGGASEMKQSLPQNVDKVKGEEIAILICLIIMD